MCITAAISRVARLKTYYPITQLPFFATKARRIVWIKKICITAAISRVARLKTYYLITQLPFFATKAQRIEWIKYVHNRGNLAPCAFKKLIT
jgi:hypothetical protein